MTRGALQRVISGVIGLWRRSPRAPVMPEQAQDWLGGLAKEQNRETEQRLRRSVYGPRNHYKGDPKG